jgi:hypothetical protein
VVVHLTQWLDEFLYVQLNIIRNVELISGHGPYGSQQSCNTVDQLTDQSKRVGRLLVNIAKCSRHQEIARSMIKFLDAGGLSGLYPQVPESMIPRLRQSNSELSSGLHVLKQRLDGTALSIPYMEERARSQSSVVRLYNRGYLSL